MTSAKSEVNWLFSFIARWVY